MQNINDDALDLGTCCACGGVVNVRNIIMLPFETSIPGTGWGCFVCHLPSNGASAVLCDACIESGAEIRYAVSGYTTKKERISYDSLTIPFLHNMKYHPDKDD